VFSIGLTQEVIKGQDEQKRTAAQSTKVHSKGNQVKQARKKWACQWLEHSGTKGKRSPFNRGMWGKGWKHPEAKGVNVWTGRERDRPLRRKDCFRLTKGKKKGGKSGVQEPEHGRCKASNKEEMVARQTSVLKGHSSTKTKV